MTHRNEFIQPIGLQNLGGGHQYARAGSSFENDPYMPYQYSENDSTKSLYHTTVDASNGLQSSETYPSTAPVVPPRDAHPWSMRNAQSWTLERVSVIISLACMVALLVIFVYFNDKPLSSWRFYFSLNTVASALGTTAKSTLMLAVGSAIGQGKWQWFYDKPQPLRDFDIFDEATRGPLGSFNLVWTLRARHLAVIGAIVTIISAASDPFLQAVVNLQGRLDVLDPVAGDANELFGTSGIVARTNRWAGLDDFAFIQATRVELNGNQYVSHPKREDFRISSAFYSGTSSYDNTGLNGTTPFFVCPTGNCTSPVYTSVGVCSQCADISGSIQKVEAINKAPEAYLRSVENLGVVVMNLTNYTLPNLWTDNCCAAQDSEYTSWLTAALSLTPEDTNAFRDMETMLAAVTFLRATPVPGNASEHEATTLPTATECALYLCVNAYQSNVTNGFLSEAQLDSWAQRVPESYNAKPQQPLGVKLDNLSAVHSNEWMTPRQELYINRADYQLSIPPDAAGNTPFGAEPTYAVSQAAIVTFQDFLTTMFPSEWEVRNGSNKKHELAYGDAIIPFYTTPILQPFLGNVSQPVNLTDMFSLIARSLTSNIRNSGISASNLPGSPSTPEQQRQVLTLQQYMLHYEISWGFFAVPFGVTLIGCVYTLYTIQRAKHRRLPAWKTSMLASLTHGMDGETREALKTLPLNGQKELASRTLVSLKERDGVIELRRGE